MYTKSPEAVPKMALSFGALALFKPMDQKVLEVVDGYPAMGVWLISILNST